MWPTGQVKLGFEAPSEVIIMRDELLEDDNFT
ncbi:MAG: carbon storage regulator [Proteobacteria bacterium]|nr:carbon storage regulator [Pseudomonadota bacterium]